MISDFVGKVLFAEDGSSLDGLLSDLEVKDRNAIIQYLRDFFNYLKKKLAGHQDILFEISHLEDSFNRMLSEAVQEQTQKNTAENSGGVKFKVGEITGDKKDSISVDMPESERAKILKDKYVKLVNTNFEIFNNNFDIADLENNIKSKVEKSLLKKFRELGFLKTYTSIAITDINFDFTGKGFSKSLHSQENYYGGSKADFAKIGMHLQELLDSSVLIETHTDKGRGSNKEKRGLKQVYVLHSALLENSTIIPVQFEIEQYENNDNRLYLAVALTKIETGVKGNTASKKQMATSLVPISNISILELFKKINPKDGKFLKYVPNDFLDPEQIQSKNSALKDDEIKYATINSKNIQFSFAKADDTSLVAQAEQMESQGANREQIWNELGLIRDSGGVWIYEMDDNGDVISLEQRFDGSIKDIRFSMPRKSVNNEQKKIELKRNSVYNEFNSIAIQWVNSADVEQGEIKRLFDGRSRKWCLAIADENSDGGYRILSIGNYEEVKEIERIYEGTNNSLHRDTEKFESTQRRSGGYSLFNEDRRNVDGSIQQTKERQLQSDTKRSNDNLLSGDKGKYVEGEAVIHSTECPDVIMYVKGRIRNPQITKIVRINAENSAEATLIQREILENEYHKEPFPYEIITNIFGEKVLDTYQKRNFVSFQEYRAEQEGKTGGKDDTDSGASSDRTIGIEQNKENDSAGLKESAFSMPDATRVMLNKLKAGEITATEYEEYQKCGLKF